MYSLISYPKLSALKRPHLRYVKRILGRYDWLKLSALLLPPHIPAKLGVVAHQLPTTQVPMRRRGPGPCESGTVLPLLPKSPAALCRSKPTAAEGHESRSSPTDGQELGERQKKERGPWQEKEGRKESEVMRRRAGAHTGVMCLLLSPYSSPGCSSAYFCCPELQCIQQ